MEKCVVVTGAAGGIGAAVLGAFSDAGYYVVGIDRVHAPRNLRCDSYVEADLDKFVSIEAYSREVIDQIRKAISGKRLAVLVNNAAVQVLAPAESLDRAGWRQTLNVNLQAPFFLSQALLTELQDARGCVINVSSVHARLTKPRFVAYATSKAALTGMTKAMAVELGSRLRVLSVEPAAVDTSMLRAGFDSDSQAFRRLEACHPTSSIGKPDELAALIVNLAENSSVFQTGSVVAFDGGIGARLHDPAD